MCSMCLLAVMMLYRDGRSVSTMIIFCCLMIKLHAAREGEWCEYCLYSCSVSVVVI
ncbi:hypothetical protein VU01_100410 [Candidatus Electrothrix marina]|uniref:Uncharacterized protein n=1 Tax=Candidatus Electrothrix marina TaxID=1859130 RepID=A0A444JHG0_9BACT|nr:hypothetical protein VU01_100410 [Candidatus Electrothrix marina]